MKQSFAEYMKIDPKKDAEWFQNTNLYYKEYGASPWEFEEGDDPELLKRSNNFKKWIWVIRNKNYDKDSVYYQQMKYKISVDPGVRLFESCFNAATGTLTLIAPQYYALLRTLEYRISNLQSERDLDVNKSVDLIELEQKLKIAKKNRARHLLDMT